MEWVGGTGKYTGIKGTTLSMVEWSVPDLRDTLYGRVSGGCLGAKPLICPRSPCNPTLSTLSAQLTAHRLTVADLRAPSA
jgi:hypothetical protein